MQKPPTDVIDASVPWNQRSALLDEENESSIEATAPAGFDLNIDELLEAQDKDEPLQPTPFTPPSSMQTQPSAVRRFPSTVCSEILLNATNLQSTR